MEGKQIVIVPYIKFCQSLGLFRLQSWECVIMSRGSANQSLVILIMCRRIKATQQFQTALDQSGSARRGQSMQFITPEGLLWYLCKGETEHPEQKDEYEPFIAVWVCFRRVSDTSTEWNYASSELETHQHHAMNGHKQPVYNRARSFDRSDNKR